MPKNALIFVKVSSKVQDLLYFLVVRVFAMDYVGPFCCFLKGQDSSKTAGSISSLLLSKLSGAQNCGMVRAVEASNTLMLKFNSCIDCLL